MAVTVTEHVNFDRPITTVYATPSCNESSSLLSSLIFRYAIGKAVEKTLFLQSLHCCLQQSDSILRNYVLIVELLISNRNRFLRVYFIFSIHCDSI